METRKTMKRRAFVKASGLAAGSVIMAPSLAGAKGFNQMDDAIKIGLIGCGGRGTGAAVQALLSGQNVQLIAMADAFADNIAESLVNIKNAIADSEVPGDRIKVTPERQFAGFEGYQKLIPLCDVVVIATPPGFRPTHFEAAVKADKHIFMEKPVAVDAPGVRRVLVAAQEAKRKKLNVVVGLQRHYEEQYLTWVELLQEGAIGDIHTSRVYWNSGGVWVRERKPGMTEMEYQMRNWYYFNWLCGDHITEQHIHNLDVGNWVKQAYPIAAYGTGGRLVRTGKEHGEIFDHHIVEFEYEDGSRMFSQCRHMPGTDSRVTEAFQGSTGSAPKPGLILTKSGHTLYEYKGDNPNPYQIEHNLLFDAVVKGEYKFEDATNAANSTMTSILGRMATYSGQLITWEDAINSNIDLSPATLAWDANPPILPNADGYYPVAVPGETKVL